MIGLKNVREDIFDIIQFDFQGRILKIARSIQLQFTLQR